MRFMTTTFGATVREDLLQAQEENPPRSRRVRPRSANSGRCAYRKAGAGAERSGKQLRAKRGDEAGSRGWRGPCQHDVMERRDECRARDTAMTTKASGR